MSGDRKISRREFASTLVDLTDTSKLQWIRVLDGPSLTLILKKFVKQGWFLIYRKRFGNDYYIVSSAIDLEKDLPSKAKWAKADV